MEHFPEQTWADFTRGFGAAGKAEGIAAHLAAGCLNCEAAHDFWGRVQAMAAAESMYTPPENLVRLAKLEMLSQKPVQSEKWTLARVLFDSVAQPLPAGIRSGVATARQLMYEAEGLIVDLRFDRVARSQTIGVVGQILDKTVPRASLTGALIVLWTEDHQLLVTTEANQFGEFHLEFVPQDGLRLSARVGDRRVQIPLANLK
jgi:hypothetical protein